MRRRIYYSLVIAAVGLCMWAMDAHDRERPAVKLERLSDITAQFNDTVVRRATQYCDEVDEKSRLLVGPCDKHEAETELH